MRQARHVDERLRPLDLCFIRSTRLVPPPRNFALSIFAAATAALSSATRE